MKRQPQSVVMELYIQLYSQSIHSRAIWRSGAGTRIQGTYSEYSAGVDTRDENRRLPVVFNKCHRIHAITRPHRIASCRAQFAKSLSLALQVPLIAVQHMQAHVLANLIPPKDGSRDHIPSFPLYVSL